MKLSDFKWGHSMNNSLRLCLCIVLIGLMVTGAIGCTAQSLTSVKSPLIKVCKAEPLEFTEDNYAPSSTAGEPPDIKVFKAEPMTLPDDASALYSFAVQGATNIQLVEAGEIIKEINGPAASKYKGTVMGRTTYQIRTGAGNTFVAMLVANNKNGSNRAILTLSFATQVPEKGSLIPPVAYEERQREKSMSPEWLDQTSSFVPPLMHYTLTITPYPPPFAPCPEDCDYCLRPDEAAAQGLTRRCLEQPCYYSPDNQQMWYCYGGASMAWCCHDGEVVETIKEKCEEAGGSSYATEAEAMKACQLPTVWCCKDGKIAEITREQCARVQGSAFATQAEALRDCQQESACWCCANGKTFQSTRSQCAQVGGSCYATQAEALRYCQQEAACWCCASGKTFQSTRSQCTQVGGSCYATQAEALRYCQQESACWCCAGGKIFQSAKSQCAQMGGACYSTQAEASRYCQPPTCWCCSYGKVYQTYQSQCAGACYSTQAEAARHCQQETTCWCCAGGKVFQSTKAQCAQMGGGCYATQSQASAACQPITRPPLTIPPTYK